jgi:hypothetical protein
MSGTHQFVHEQLEWRMQMPIDEAVERHPELVVYVGWFHYHELVFPG